METQRKSRNGPRFTGKAAEVDALDIGRIFSEDRLAATLPFDNLRVDLGDRPGVYVITRTASISIPVENNNQDLRLTQGISGFVSVDGAARAVLLVQAAGGTTLVDLRKSERDTEEDGNSFSFTEMIEGELRAGANYQVTFFLLVERDVDHSETGASLGIDSLDLEINDSVEEQ
ncbi:MAG: hypothetical protein D3923_03240 [Candidatus Electrothrix sp. AR3]|nr:hypothetical protein [Candidatus Electrothrix sp. AR3]